MSAAQGAHPTNLEATGRKVIAGHSCGWVADLPMTFTDSYLLVFTLVDVLPSHNESGLTPVTNRQLHKGFLGPGHKGLHLCLDLLDRVFWEGGQLLYLL